MKIKKVANAAGKVLSIFSIVFVVYAIYKVGFDFSTIRNWPLFIAIFAIGIVLKIISVFVSASTWTLWLQFWANKSVNTIDGICVYTKANIGKYIPGNVMHYVERNMFAADMGIDQKRIAVSTLMEIICQVFMALFIFVCTGADTLKLVFAEIFHANLNYTVLILGIGMIVGILAVFVLYKKVFKKALQEYRLSEFIKTLILALARYFIVLSLLGIIMVLLYGYAGGAINFKIACSIVSGYIVAWVLGFITPGASGGIGVRELVIILLLGPVMGKELVISLSVIHRLITVIGDFLAYFIRMLIKRN